VGVGVICGLCLRLGGSVLLPYVSSKDIASLCGFLIVFVGVHRRAIVAIFRPAGKAAGWACLTAFWARVFGAVRGLLFAVR